VHAYSNLSAASVRLVQLQRKALSQRQPRRRTTTLVPQRVERRLGAELIGQVVSDYAAGMSSTRLARQYGIGKGTVLRLIRKCGGTIRRKGPAPDRIRINQHKKWD
jgi:DNA invertase Pin-like site-specific DNA recombinase